MKVSDLKKFASQLRAAVAAYPVGPDLPDDHPATIELRRLGEAIAALGGMTALRDTVLAADPERDGIVGRRVNKIWHGLAGWQM